MFRSGRLTKGEPLMRCMLRWFTPLLPVILLISACQPLLIPAAVYPSLELRGHVSGSALAVAVQGDYAYLGFSYELVVLDIADRSNPQWVTSLPIPANDIALAGDYAYVVGRDGFTVVDINDPTQPQLLGHLTSEETAASVIVAEGDAYFVEDRRLHQVDITGPTHPKIKSTLTLSSRIEQLAVADGYLYLSSYSGLHVLAISDQAQPSEVCLIETNGYTSGAAIANGYAYFVSREVLHIVDITTPGACHPIAQIAFPGMVSELIVVDNIAYLVNGSRGLRVWNLANVQEPVELGIYPVPLAVALTIQDGYLYLADCAEGLQIFTTVDPAHLPVVGVFTPVGAATDLAVTGDYAYVTAGFTNNIHQIAVADPAQVHTIRRHLTNAEVNGLNLADDALYLMMDAGLQVIDLATPDTPVMANLYPIINPTIQNLWHVVVNYPYAYLGDINGNVWIINLAEPTSVIDAPSYTALGNVGAMALVDNYAYLPAPGLGVRILEVAATGELTQVGLYGTTETIYQIAVARGDVYIVGPQGLSIVDVREPSAPTLVYHDAIMGVAHDLAIAGDYVFIATDNDGLQALDITNPAQPITVATFATPDCARKVVTANGRIYVTARFGGLYIFTLITAP